MIMLVVTRRKTLLKMYIARGEDDLATLSIPPNSVWHTVTPFGVNVHQTVELSKYILPFFCAINTVKFAGNN